MLVPLGDRQARGTNVVWLPPTHHPVRHTGYVTGLHNDMKPDLPKWRRLKTEELFRHPHITLLEDTVVLPSGRESKWLRWEGSGTACIVCLNEQREVLVSYQYNNAPQRVVEEFPGGGILNGEEPSQAARRELAEEVGLRAGNLEKFGQFLSSNRRTDNVCHVFLATDLVQVAARPDDNEIVGTEWVAIEELDRRIAEGTIENGHMLAVWTLFKSRMSK